MTGQEPDKFNKDVWNPLCTRVDFTRFTKHHEHDTEFPYSEKQLAYALDLLCRWPKLCEDLKPLDEEQPPDACEDVEKWHKEQDEKQQKAFNTGLEKLKKTWPVTDIAPNAVEDEEEEQKEEENQVSILE